MSSSSKKSPLKKTAYWITFHFWKKDRNGGKFLNLFSKLLIKLNNQNYQMTIVNLFLTLGPLAYYVTQVLPWEKQAHFL